MEQNYKNHSRIVIGYHGILLVLLVAGLIGSVINLFQSWNAPTLYSASLIVLLFVCTSIIYGYTRIFPLKAQDRAIRAEENFRHYLITGKTLPAELKMDQIIALRFACDEEFQDLMHKAIQEKLSGKDIKQAIKKWKADHYRV